jgi:DeoR family transcriptional regulator, fructose operon transcriptional repressor
LIEHQITTYVVGGLVKPKTKALVGSGALNSLSSYRFDKCFMGINGIHLDAGFTTPDPEEAAVKRLAISLSQEVFILADYSKFNEASFSKVADLNEAVIITNELDEDAAYDFEDKTNIRVVTP